MKILIANDDGINAEGIKLLCAWASRFGDVTVVAPKEQQSGKSRSIEISKPLELKKVSFPYAKRAFTLSSTPADCVRAAYNLLDRHYDLVLSGINHGYNIGQDIPYSGTVGVIFEAVHLGMKAVAVSSEVNSVSSSAEYLDRIYDFFIRNRLLDFNDAYNVNIPPYVKGIRPTLQGQGYFTDRFIPYEESKYIQEGYYIPDPDLSVLHYDTIAVENGLISVMPLKQIVDEKQVYEKIKNCR